MREYKILSNGIILVELDGTEGHYQQGLQLGEILKNRILDSIQYVRNWYCGELGQEDGEKLIRKLQIADFMFP